MSKCSEHEKSFASGRRESSNSSGEESDTSHKDKDAKINNDSDCESLISDREGIINKKKNEMMQKIIRSKLGGKSILEIAKDLNGSISVKN